MLTSFIKNKLQEGLLLWKARAASWAVGNRSPGLALVREKAIKVKNPNQSGGELLATTALTWTLSAKKKQQFCLASGELLFLPEEKKLL